jgi:LEA14-like dessication related protein
MENIIHYAFILDQSGSMQCLKQEVVTSYNEQVEAISKLKLNNPDSEIKFTLCVFND